MIAITSVHNMIKRVMQYSGWLHYRPKSLGQGNIFSSVSRIRFTGGGSASVHAGIPPPEQTPHWEQASPVQCMLGDTVNKWAVCILLECNLV